MSYCKHFNVGGWFSSDYCDIHGERENIPSSYYDSCKNEGYKCPWYEKEYGTSGGCFITTITCKILNKKDDDEVMESLRKFRDNILQKNEKYDEILKIYDSIGPELARIISREDRKEEIANELYEYSLKPIAELVKKEEYDRAVEHYMYMTLYLCTCYPIYGMKSLYNYLYDMNFGYQEGEFDRKTAGHGKKVQLTLEKQREL